VTDEPTPDKPEPLPVMTDEEIVKYARGVITQEYMLADRVPALTTNCTMVPVESVEALITQCDAFYAALHPEEAAAQGQSDTTD
jgi:hypothetical protein